MCVYVCVSMYMYWLCVGKCIFIHVHICVFVRMYVLKVFVVKWLPSYEMDVIT